MLARIMLLLMGSERNVKKIMPDPKAHDQLRAALRSGRPVWWKMFSRRFKLEGEDKTAVLPKPRVAPAAKPISLDEARARREALREALAAAEIPWPPALGGKSAPAHDDPLADVLETPLEVTAAVAQP
jgi:hypothetical protein